MSSTQNKAFYEAVTCVLSCALQADSDIQRLAEERKKALEVIDDYPYILMEIIGNSEEALAEKHMASIFLKNYFHNIYLNKRDNQLFKNPLSVCKLSFCLIDLLKINFLGIKMMVCKSLSYIVYKGFWGLVDPKILYMLKSDNEEDLYNSVFFLKQLMNFEDYKFGVQFKVSQEYFEVLLGTFKKNIISEIRCLTIPPMYFILCHLTVNSDVQENALSRLGLEFYNILKEPYSENSDFKLKSEIIKYIAKFEIVGPTKHCYIITNSLPAIGQLMTNCCDQFKEIVKETSSIPKDNFEDSTKESSNFIDLISFMIDLIKNMVYSMYFDLVIEDLDNLLYCLFVFMCCYDDMEDELFLDEEEQSRAFPIRSNSAQILSHIRHRVSQSRKRGLEIFYKSMHNVLHKMIGEVSMVTANRRLYQDRVTEALMYGLGTLHYHSEEDTGFHHNYYIDNWTAQMQQGINSTTLNGRLLWLGGIFSHILNTNTLSVHLKAMIQNIQGEVSYLYVPSIEALKKHMVTYDQKKMPQENRYVMKSLSKELLECLLTMIQKVNNNPTSSLNALGIFVKYHEDCTFAYLHNVQEILINIIFVHISNVPVMKEVNFILENLVLHKNLQESLYHNIVPFLCKILRGNIPEQLRTRKDSIEKVLELLNTIALHTTQPINEVLVLEGFSGAANLILDREIELDCNLNLVAINFIMTMILKVGSQLQYLKNSKETPLTEFIPKIVFESINSMRAITGLQVGKLCVISILTLPDLMEPHFESILKSVLSSVQADTSFEKLRGFWLIFVYIYMCRPVNTANFLSSIPGPEGGSALNYLINMWQPEYASMITKFERTVIMMALIQILTSALESNSEKLQEVDVRLCSNDRNISKMSGIEYLYYSLICLVLMEQSRLKTETTHQSVDILNDDDIDKKEEDKVLLENTPLNLDVLAATTQFLKHENAYYFNVCRYYLYHEEIIRLSNMGCTVPQISME